MNKGTKFQVKHKQKTTVYVVMIRDLFDFDINGRSIINECAVFAAKNKARAHLKTVVESYKADGINEHLYNGNVGFNADTDKDYVMIETEDSFTYYKQGYYSDNQLRMFSNNSALCSFRYDSNSATVTPSTPLAPLFAYIRLYASLRFSLLRIFSNSSTLPFLLSVDTKPSF